MNSFGNIVDLKMVFEKYIQNIEEFYARLICEDRKHMKIEMQQAFIAFVLY